MTFSEYAKKYQVSAGKFGIPQFEIEKSLNYAKTLFENKVVVIYDQVHFSKLVGYELDFILSISNHEKLFYRSFKIPKRNNKFRTIHEPLPSLKEIQTWILHYILTPASKKFVSPVAKAFMPKLSIRDNARFHRGQKILVCLDLKDFFDTVSFPQVYHIFCLLGYKKNVATLLTRLCLLKNKLPQGAPTSPMLSNFVFKFYDDLIINFCTSRGIRYTRYADDLTFSGDFNPGEIIRYVESVLSHTQFKINAAKTKVLTKAKRQQVTGVVVNQKIQVSRDYRNKIRQEVYYCIKYGVEEHLKRINYPYNAEQYIRHLLGKVNFTLLINKQDARMAGYYEYLQDMLKGYQL